MSRQARQLTLLTEISRELTSILNVDELLKRIADLVTRIIDYQMFSILLLDKTGSVLQHRFSLRFKESVQLKHEIPLGVGLVGYAAQHRQAVLVPDVSKDPRYIKANPETRSELCIPLIYKDKVIGVLDIEHTRRGYFTEDHVRIMTTLAAQVAIAIENATLYEQIARQEKRLEQDLALARELQFRLLPQKLPLFRNAEVASRFAPARQIGGDLYDFLKYSGQGVTGIAVGDVSGKGAPAAIYAALVSGIARSHANEEPSAAGMLEAINLSLVGAADRRAIRLHDLCHLGRQPATAADRKFRFAASDSLPRRQNRDRFRRPACPSDCLTTRPTMSSICAAIAGDVFLFFSDGILDATSSKGELFGRHRLEKIVRDNARRSAEELVDTIFTAVSSHAEGVEAFDDQTIVAIKVKGTSAKK